MDDLINETKKSQNDEVQRAKSVITSRFEAEIQRKLKLAEARKKLDKVLYAQKQNLKDQIQTPFRKQMDDRRNILLEKQQKKDKF